eukprot:GSMAST32.ASY1.ANO1.1312.1 assembled CDS
MYMNTIWKYFFGKWYYFQNRGTSVGCIGDIFVDVNTSQLSSIPAWGEDREVHSVDLLLGGGCCNTARLLGGLGVHSVRLFGAVGGCNLGRWVLSKLFSEGLVLTSDSVIVLNGESQATCLVLVNDKAERAFVSCRGCVSAFNMTHVNRNLFNGVDHLHIGGYFSCNGLQNGVLSQVIKTRITDNSLSLTVSLDPQYDASGKWTGFERDIYTLLKLITVFLPSESEAFAISNTNLTASTTPSNPNPKDTLKSHSTNPNPTSESVLLSGRFFFRCSPFKGVVEVDSTGAGDAFNAGFLHIWLPARNNASNETLHNALVYVRFHFNFEFDVFISYEILYIASIRF